MSEELTTLGSELLGGGVSGAVVAALAWLGISVSMKESIKHTYEVEMEALKAASKRELEQAKHELRQETEQKRIEYEAIFEKRGELIAALYKDLLDAVEAASAAMSPARRLPFAEAITRIQSLHGKMDAAAIYFPEEFCKQWSDCVSNLAIGLRKLDEADSLQTKNWESDRKILVEAVDKNMHALRDIRYNLRNEIRRMLGVARS